MIAKLLLPRLTTELTDLNKARNLPLLTARKKEKTEKFEINPLSKNFLKNEKRNEEEAATMSSTDGANVSAEAMERELNAKTRQLESLAIQQKKKEVTFVLFLKENKIAFSLGGIYLACVMLQFCALI